MTPEILNHILYVDDEPDMRMLVKAVLENDGMHVVLCESGLEMLEAAHEDRPQMIMLDVMMAGMNGPELLREIKGEPAFSDVPVIFLTGKSNPDDMAALKASGAAGVIAKPFDLMALPAQVRSLWEASRG